MYDSWMKICIEGASAIGKSVLARALAAKWGTDVIPEVNVLFSRPLLIESRSWYFERQVERWQLASRRDHAILDGDLFQPLWYNWVYQDEGWQTLAEIREYYRSEVEFGRLAFPDLYLILQASTEEIRRRCAEDPSRRRANFEKHLRFIEPQNRYFRKLIELCPGRVVFIPAEKRDEILGRAVVAIEEYTDPTTAKDSLGILDGMLEWLATTLA